MSKDWANTFRAVSNYVKNADLSTGVWMMQPSQYKNPNLNIFQNVQLVMGLDESGIPGLNSLTEEMEKKKTKLLMLLIIIFKITVFMVCDPFLAIE